MIYIDENSVLSSICHQCLESNFSSLMSGDPV